MPLHLLGKKSWNVYNADNIARVRRDEAAAKAAEEAEEQRMQEVDAQRRLAILRGQVPPAALLDAQIETEAEEAGRPPLDEPGVGTKRPRKRQGEDDTDFEMRLAQTRRSGDGLEVATIPKKDTSSAPIVDQTGHIDLFGSDKQRAHAEKNEHVEHQKRKKQQEHEDQYRIRLATAAGKNAPSNPWYSHGSSEVPEGPSKDVWGNDDLKRKDRQTQRMVTNDPLMMMKSGAAKVRELKKERKAAQEERDRELKDMIREERHREKRERRHGRSRDGEGRSRKHRSRSRDRERRGRHDGGDGNEEGKDHRDRHGRRDRSRRHEEEGRRSRTQRPRSRSPRR